MDRPYRLGKPVGPFAPLLIAALVLGSCDDAQQGTAPLPERSDTIPDAEHEMHDTLKRKLERAANRDKVQVPVLEPVRRDMRIIGEGDFPAPRISGETVERVEPAQSADERNNAQIARLPKKPDSFPRPLVLSAGSFRSGDTVVVLEGIRETPADMTCISSNGNWPCGNFAKAALQRLIRSRTISCEGKELSTGNYSGRCRMGNSDLSRWLVEQGWAEAVDPALKAAEAQARKTEKGLWRN